MPTVNVEYDFVTVFKLVRELYNDCHSNETIWDTLDETLTKKQLRDIIFLGIKQYYDRTNDFSIIQNVYQALVTH